MHPLRRFTEGKRGGCITYMRERILLKKHLGGGEGDILAEVPAITWQRRGGKGLSRNSKFLKVSRF